MRARLADLGMAAVPLGFGLLGRGRHDFSWGLPLSVGFGVPLYWGRRHPLPVLLAAFAIGLAQVIAALADGVNAITLIAEAVSLRQRAASVDSSDAEIMAAEPSAYRSLFVGPHS